MKPTRAPALRIVLYPGDRMSRTVMHTAATGAGLLLALRMGGPWWLWLGWYCLAFLGLHVVAMPVMTAWHATLDWFDNRVRSIVADELVAFDMRTYARQLQRILPHSPDEKSE